MPDNDAPSPKDYQSGDAAKNVAELLLKDEELRRSLGRRTSYAILISAILATAKITIGIPFLSPGLVPLVAIIVVFLIATAEDWLLGKHPQTIFYLCPDEGRYIPISESVHPIYRKINSCPHCGCGLIKRCRGGKHFIISSDPNNPNTPPGPDGFCPFCKPSLPKTSRAYLPETKKPVDNE
ncbi:MAG: hypothetical protein ACREEM_26535 [Blastocatellia bacterium]